MLPMKAKFIKELTIKSDSDEDRECALIELEPLSPDGPLPCQYLAILPRDSEIHLFKDDSKDLVLLYAFKGQNYLDKDVIDFADKPEIEDVGILASIEEAEKCFQIK